MLLGADGIQLRELQAEEVALEPEDSDFLLERREELHIDARLCPGKPGVWLLQPGAWCGVVPLPSGRAIYIEPKAPIGNLLHMLRYAYDKFEVGPDAAGLRRVDELLEMLVEIFARRVSLLVDRGLLRSYQPQRENLLQLRGRLDVAGNIRYNLTARHRLMCSFDEFTTDIVENRILRYTLYWVRCAKLKSASLRQRLDRCERRMAEAELMHITEDDFAELRFTRLNEHYRTPLNLARLLLNMLSVTHRRGEAQAVPLLLDMVRVFELFLQRLIQEHFGGKDVGLRFQEYSRKLDEGGVVSLKPDIVILKGREPVCIADAKYKVDTRAEAEGSDPTKPSNDDVYQMLAYCIGYGVHDAVLLYPETRKRGEIVVSRNGVHACIHSLGIDLTGDKDQFGRQAEELCGKVEGIVQLAVGRSWELATALA